MCTNTVHRNKKSKQPLANTGNAVSDWRAFQRHSVVSAQLLKKKKKLPISLLLFSLFHSFSLVFERFLWNGENRSEQLYCGKETQLKDTFSLCVVAAISAALLSLSKASSPRSLPLFDWGNSEKQQQQQHTTLWLCVGLCLTAHYAARWMQCMQLFLAPPPESFHPLVFLMQASYSCCPGAWNINVHLRGSWWS